MDPKNVNDDPSAADAGDESEFDKAFAEATSEGTSSADEGEAQKPEGEASADTPNEQTGDDVAGEDQPVKQDEPAPTDQQAPVDEDPWAAVPPELRAQHDTLKRNAAQLRSQLSASDRQLNQLRRQTQNPTKDDGKDVATMLGSDAVKSLRDEYGEVAGPLVDMIEALNGKVASMEGSLSNAEARHDETLLNEQLSIYEREHQDWQEYANHPGWQDWIGAQPRHIREAAARNADFIVDGVEAADVLTRFKASLPAPPPPPSPDLKREAQLAGARTVPTSSPPAASGEPEDFDAAFANAAEKLDKARGLKTAV